MPLFRDGLGSAPAWCELTSFEVLRLPAGARHDFPRIAPRERLIVASGTCRLACGAEQLDAAAGTRCELRDPEARFAVQATREPTTMVRLCGTWGDETGGWGLFQVAEVEHPVERGDPVDYPKRTNMDNHYHDCDEYYIILEGRGTVVSEGRHYEVGPGDCVATRRGDHHGVPLAPEPVTAVYLETTLRGRRRRGHLWDHTHGPAEPHPERL